MNNSILCDKRYPIEQPDDFIGREEIIWQIKDKVFSGRRNCIAIIADDGMGKSSLINYIYFEETQKNLIDNYEKIYWFCSIMPSHQVSKISFYFTRSNL